MVLIFSCLELFLPAGELNRFVRLGGGMILLALIVIPAANALTHISWALPGLPDTAAENTWADKAEDITYILEKEAMNVYEADTAADIAAVVRLTPGITEADAVLTAAADGSVEKLEITARADTSPAEAEQAIRAELNKFFIADKDKIIIFIRGE